MSPGHALVHNLTVLNFTPPTAGPYYNLSILPDTFTQAAPQPRHFQLVSHFLFGVIDPTSDQLQPWPPTYGSIKESRDFGLSFYRWCEDLKKAGRLDKGLVLRRTYVDECRGERLLDILVAVSRHAVVEYFGREGKVHT
jgi:hypothetical protein